MSALMERTELAAESLIPDFEACRIDPEAFDHRAHLKLAWLYLDDRPLWAAAEALTEGLKRLTRTLGAEDKYHETITWAYVLLIHDRRARLGDGHAWSEFEATNPDLFCTKPSALATYYRAETLNSELARRTFVMPDRVS